MYGTNCYEIWVEKYGKDDADKRKDEMNDKISNTKSGVPANFSEDVRKNIGQSVIKRLSKAVCQYDKNGKFLNEFYSINEASRHTNINSRDIGQAMSGRRGRKTAGGFIWKNKTETTNIV